MRTAAYALASAIAFGLLSAPAALQQAQKGGEDETGPYEVVANWPQPWSPQGYIWGSQPGVFAETPNRIFLAVRGELKLPATLGRGYNGIWGSLGERATVPKAEMRNCILVVDAAGKQGAFVKAWGTKGDGPGQFSGPHGIETDKSGRIYVADRGNRRIQIFDADGTHLDTWPNIRFPNHIIVSADEQHVWVSDGNNARILEYDRNGKLLYWWGVYGTIPGTFWEMHQFSVDSDGNLYAADSFGGRTQKFRPRADADRSKLVGAPIALMPKSTQ